MELNRDKIMKCLRHCNGGDCETCKVLGTACDASWTFHKDALALIKQLTEENEKLKAENKTLEIYNKDYKFKNTELLKFNRRWAKECAELQDECDQIKENTILKMQNKILALSTYGTINISSWQLEQIVKELLEINK